MLVKSRGIVLRRIRYNDSDSIVSLYSSEFGRISYLVGNHRRRKAVNPACLQPLSLIEYEADHHNGRELQRLKEIRPLCPLTDIPMNPVKNGISMFLAEILTRVLNEAEANPTLFDYLLQSVEILDRCQAGAANFHLVFLIKLSIFLGFYPNISDGRKGGYFDLQAGCFTPARPLHNAWLSPEEARKLVSLMQMRFDNMETFRFSRQQRTAVLHRILDYYRLHLADFPEIKSLAVLEECFE